MSNSMEVISPTEFEVVLYLNQMGVFNFVDDGSLPGCAVLKVTLLLCEKISTIMTFDSTSTFGW